MPFYEDDCTGGCCSYAGSITWLEAAKIRMCDVYCCLYPDSKQAPFGLKVRFSNMPWDYVYTEYFTKVHTAGEPPHDRRWWYVASFYLALNRYTELKASEKCGHR